MPDKQMTEAEIMKALEDKAKAVCGICDGKLGNTVSCENCIFYAIKFVLDLLNLKNEVIKSFTEIGKLYSEIKAEAIKEVIERLKEYTYHELGSRDEVVMVERIDQIAKEMGVEL